jgi:hypothetical protein
MKINTIKSVAVIYDFCYTNQPVKIFKGRNMGISASLETYHPDLLYVMLQNAQDSRMSREIAKLFDQEKILESRMHATRELVREFNNIASSMKKGDQISLERDYADQINRYQQYHFPNHQEDNPHCVTNDNNPFTGNNFEHVTYNLLGDMIEKLDAIERLDQFGMQTLAQALLDLSRGNAEIATMIAERFRKKTEMKTFVDNQISR